MRSDLTRRHLLGLTATAAGGLVAAGSQTPASANEPLDGFPAGVPVQREVYQNWDGTVRVPGLWTATPQTTRDVVAIVNWAHQHDYRVRVQGMRHTWAPLTVPADLPAREQVLLIDLTEHLTAISLVGERAVRVQTGAQMESVLAYLGERDLGLTSAPAPGQITVGGVLAINGHGTAIPAAGERRAAGSSYGTVSNLVLELLVIAWDERAGRYQPRRVRRDEPDAAALLTHLGRALVLEVTLQAKRDDNLRCRNYTDITTSTLFAAPDQAGPRSLTRLLDRAGRVGIIWYAFTERPWVQVWEITPRRPLTSRPVPGPYNYVFADNLPSPVPELLGDLIEGHDWVAPAFGRAVYAATATGLTTTAARDMWGPSKNFIHFVKTTTLRVTAGSHAVLVRRSDVQQVVHDFAEHYTGLLERYRREGSYPVNSGMEIRVTGVDRADEVDQAGAVTPALSAAAPVPGRPELDTVVWLDMLTLPDTADQGLFYADLEAYLQGLPKDRYVVRAEWSKRWGHTADGVAWRDRAKVARSTATLAGFEAARATFDRLDPYRLFTTELHRTIGL